MHIREVDSGKRVTTCISLQGTLVQNIPLPPGILDVNLVCRYNLREIDTLIQGNLRFFLIWQRCITARLYIDRAIIDARRSSSGGRPGTICLERSITGRHEVNRIEL